MIIAAQIERTDGHPAVTMVGPPVRLGTPCRLVPGSVNRPTVENVAHIRLSGPIARLHPDAKRVTSTDTEETDHFWRARWTSPMRLGWAGGASTSASKRRWASGRARAFPLSRSTPTTGGTAGPSPKSCPTGPRQPRPAQVDTPHLAGCCCSVGPSPAGPDFTASGEPRLRLGTLHLTLLARPARSHGGCRRVRALYVRLQNRRPIVRELQGQDPSSVG